MGRSEEVLCNVLPEPADTQQGESQGEVMKLHLVSIWFRGKTYSMFVLRDVNDTKVHVSLEEFEEYFPELVIYPGQTFSIC